MINEFFMQDVVGYDADARSVEVFVLEHGPYTFNLDLFIEYLSLNKTKLTKKAKDKLIKRFLKLNPGPQYIWLFCKYTGDNDMLVDLLAKSNVRDADIYRYYYCNEVKDRPELWQRFTSPEARPFAQALYCKDICDREEIWQALAANVNDDAVVWQQWYCREVKRRPEIVAAAKKNMERGL